VTGWGLHGASGYTNDGCRCDVCRAANTARCARRTEERRRELWEDPTLAQHGRASTYTNWGCRCEPCTEAIAAKLREYRQRKAAKEAS
jgi:hypothetical protein